MDRFYELLAKDLNTDVVRRDDTLEDFDEWDSLTVLSIVAMIGEEYGVEVSAADLVDVTTAGDLEDLVRRKHAVST